MEVEAEQTNSISPNITLFFSFLFLREALNTWGHSLDHAGLRVLHPAGADGRGQVDEASGGCAEGRDGTELQAAPPDSQHPATAQASAERPRVCVSTLVENTSHCGHITEIFI